MCDVAASVPRRFDERHAEDRSNEPAPATPADALARLAPAGMTKTEATWAARVAEWRASGETAPAFCKGKEFTAGGLRYWSSRLCRAEDVVPAEEVRIARVVRPAPAASAAETAIVIEVGAARLAVRRGFDREVLRAVLDLLGGGR